MHTANFLVREFPFQCHFVDFCSHLTQRGAIISSATANVIMLIPGMLKSREDAMSYGTFSRETILNLWSYWWAGAWGNIAGGWYHIVWQWWQTSGSKTYHNPRGCNHDRHRFLVPFSSSLFTVMLDLDLNLLMSVQSVLLWVYVADATCS